MSVKKNLQKIVQHTVAQFKNRTFSLIFINLVIITSQLLYIFLRFKYLNPTIPFWFTKNWGNHWLTPKVDIYFIPLISAGIFLFGLLLILLNRFYIKYIYELIWSCVIFCNVFLSCALVNIIKSASVPFEPFINPLYVPLFIPFIIAFLFAYFILPYFIDYAHSKRLITNPQEHDHPAMILELPSARGGGFIFSLVFLIVSLFYVGISKEFLGLYISVLMIASLGLIDDFQNTHPLSSFKIVENPFLRLFLLFLAVTPTVSSGIIMDYISNPFDGVIVLSSIHPFLPAIFTTIWIVWVMNILSWSNGVDGQYCGIVGIASVVLALLALRFEPIEPIHMQVAILAAISAGAAFGFAKYNWHPSKIMWGFGAISAGLILSALSISVRGKILTSVLIILVPFLDAIVTVVRRIVQGKSPFSGDRGHLHHLLLDRGWSVKKIARFYWLTTAFFGFLGVLFPERYSIQATLIIAGLVAFMIILLNLKSAKNKNQQLEAAK